MRDDNELLEILKELDDSEIAIHINLDISESE